LGKVQWEFFGSKYEEHLLHGLIVQTVSLGLMMTMNDNKTGALHRSLSPLGEQIINFLDNWPELFSTAHTAP